ncbi:MAG: ZIP family zinc transporter [Chloroflexota bacterium]|nr:ZIP family zinc transporter [Chloroflexota bacterium]
MLAAGVWALVAASSLVLGALLSLTNWIEGRRLRLLIAFGAGTLVSAVAYDLVEEAVHVSATGWSVGAGFVVGALAFYVGDEIIDRLPGAGGADGGGGLPILLGAVLDGIPESIVLGLTLVGGGAPSSAVLVAIFVSNVPESVASSTKMREAGRSPLWIVAIWAVVAAASAVAAAVGYGLLAGSSGDNIAFMDAFAAGAILVLLADHLLPEAHADRDKVVGVMAASGFALAAVLSFTD